MGYVVYDPSGNPTSSTPSAGGGGGGSGGPTGSRAILDFGGYANTGSSTALWTPILCNVNATSGSTGATGMEGLPKIAYPFTVTGWQLQQYVANGQQRFQICKNRVGQVIPYIDVPNAGNATVNGFPGSSFSGQFAAGTYTFTPSDAISAVVGFGSGTSTNMRLQLIIEWL